MNRHVYKARMRKLEREGAIQIIEVATIAATLFGIAAIAFLYVPIVVIQQQPLTFSNNAVAQVWVYAEAICMVTLAYGMYKYFRNR